METVSKETINESFKVNPPDPGADGKFWETEDSSADSDDDEEQNLINESMKCGSRKRKSKPSSLLDGTLESALRRYSLRSDAGGSTAAQKKHQNKKSKTTKKELGLHAGARSRMDKENDPSKVNLLNDVAMIREDTPTNLVKDRNIHQSKEHTAQSGSYQIKGNEVAGNQEDKHVEKENRQTLHLDNEDKRQERPVRVKPKKPSILVVETSNRFNLLDGEGNTIEVQDESTESVNTADDIPDTNDENTNGTPMEEVESDTDAMATLMKADNLETHQMETDLDMPQSQQEGLKDPNLTLLKATDSSA
ncbi:hypothetical protein L1987_87026 [Smallanthus sonchifolius]|uniref:Uncharacterized protein n=2 Tax=Smallanthus sonchifolius TaxID=185202 RepID=A0ACB8Y127_9ASTR|nr:hypothetical protein L1987_87013 [Smallanthus sonchifolius]KAI3677398.1 hypothetical protein L1987_87026 [Smallanthus sonchifolius]